MPRYDTRRQRRRPLILLAVLAAVLGMSACAARPPGEHSHPVIRVEHNVEGGDPEEGAEAIRDYGCTACHIVPRLERTPEGLVGPPLTLWARRAYIAGRLANGTDNLLRWLLSPSAVDPETAMPATGLAEEDARDIAAFLYTLDSD